MLNIQDYSSFSFTSLCLVLTSTGVIENDEVKGMLFAPSLCTQINYHCRYLSANAWHDLTSIKFHAQTVLPATMEQVITVAYIQFRTYSF